ncbi:hypothetical protein FOCC_FOCC002067 [Frankliniella occidentalis]|nr:hypothetical protein FOCC_FOCC002067 [Frankliniella occidentalis]
MSSKAAKFVKFTLKTPVVYMFKWKVEYAVPETKDHLIIALSSKVMVQGLPTPLVKKCTVRNFSLTA